MQLKVTDHSLRLGLQSRGDHGIYLANVMECLKACHLSTKLILHAYDEITMRCHQLPQKFKK